MSLKRFSFFFIFLFFLSFSLKGEVLKKFPLTASGTPMFDINAGMIKVFGNKIFVADRSEYNIKVFSESGKYLYKIGEKGEGPGRFKRWFGVFTMDSVGNIYQGDYFQGNRFINVFTKKGKLIKTIKIKLNKDFGIEDIFIMDNKNIYLGLSYGYDFKKIGKLYFWGTKYHISKLVDGKIKKEIFTGTSYHDFSDERKGGWPSVPFEIYYLTAFSLKNRMIAVCKNNEDKIHIYNLKNRTKAIIYTGWKKRLIDRGKFQKAIKEKLDSPRLNPYFKNLYKKLKIKYLPDKNKPMIERFVFNPEGELIVCKKTAGKLYKIKKFSTIGKKLKEFQDTNFPFFISKTKLYYIDYDRGSDTIFIIIKKRGENY